jgi:hypothetical protein
MQQPTEATMNRYGVQKPTTNSTTQDLARRLGHVAPASQGHEEVKSETITLSKASSSRSSAPPLP